MNKYVKIGLIVVLLGGSVYLYNTEFSKASSAEVLDGYNEKEAEASFEEVKDQFPEKPIKAGNAGLNPAHGQPGHRCDIPVGASLDTPLKSNNSGLLNAGSTAMKNPPHGQPGHRCDLAVGAPLPQ